MRAAVSEGAKKVERRWVRPVEVFEKEDNRLGPRTRQNPGSHCRQLPSPQLFGREIRDTCRRQRDVHEWCEQWRIFGWVEADQTQRAFEVGEAFFGGRIWAKPQPTPFGDRMQRRVLQKLRGAPFDPGVRRLREPSVELVDEPRLADARLADDEG